MCVCLTGRGVLKCNRTYLRDAGSCLAGVLTSIMSPLTVLSEGVCCVRELLGAKNILFILLMTHRSFMCDRKAKPGAEKQAL